MLDAVVFTAGCVLFAISLTLILYGYTWTLRLARDEQRLYTEHEEWMTWYTQLKTWYTDDGDDDERDSGDSD